MPSYPAEKRLWWYPECLFLNLQGIRSSWNRSFPELTGKKFLDKYEAFRKPGADFPESMDKASLLKQPCGRAFPERFTYTVRISILFCGRLDKLCSNYYLSTMKDILTMERL